MTLLSCFRVTKPGCGAPNSLIVSLCMFDKLIKITYDGSLGYLFSSLKLENGIKFTEVRDYENLTKNISNMPVIVPINEKKLMHFLSSGP
jgi:hypothetical protein